MSSTEDWLLEILEAVRIGGWLGAEPDSREPNYLDTDVAESIIRQHMLSEAMEILNKFDLQILVQIDDYQHLNGGFIDTMTLRKAFTEKYGERE